MSRRRVVLCLDYVTRGHFLSGGKKKEDLEWLHLLCFYFDVTILFTVEEEGVICVWVSSDKGKKQGKGGDTRYTLIKTKHTKRYHHIENSLP